MAENLEKLASLGALKKLGEAAKNAIPTAVSELTNDSQFQTKDDVDKAIKAQVSSVYKPMGSKEFAQLPEPAVELVGNVYNVTDKFTTDDKFVEGAGKKYPAGTNVVIVEVDGEYKRDVLAGEIDLSNYVEKDGSKVLSTNDYTTDDKNKLAGIKDGATKTEASETAGNIKIDGSEVTVVSIASDEEAQAVIDEVFPTE